jgi:hypothetical protein
MSLTTIDPKAAPLVIDLQKRVVHAPTVHPSREIRLGETATTSEILDTLDNR